MSVVTSPATAHVPAYGEPGQGGIWTRPGWWRALLWTLSAAAKAAGKTKATDLAGFIRESITDPNAYIAKKFAPNVMPGNFATKLSSKQLDDVAAYLAKGGAGK